MVVRRRPALIPARVTVTPHPPEVENDILNYLFYRLHNLDIFPLKSSTFVYVTYTPQTPTRGAHKTLTEKPELAGWLND